MKIQTLFRFLLLLFLLVTLGGCSLTETAPEVFQASDEGAELPPRVIASNPSGGQEIPVDGMIVIEFDQAMDQAATAEAWGLLDIEGAAVPGDIIWPDEATLKFTPDELLEPGASYTARLSAQASSAEGVSLAEELTFIVNTVGNLEISQVFPADGSEDVENAAVITVVFNRPVVPLLIVEQMDELPDPLQITPDLAGQGEWLNTSVYIFRPDEPLRSAAQYDFTVAADLVAGLEEDYAWSFTTAAPSIANFKLIGLTTNPGDLYADVPPDQTFSISFRQPMDQAKTQAAFSLVSSLDETVPVDLAWDEDSTKLTIAPLEPLAFESSYKLQLTEAAQDTWGGSLQEGLKWRFSTYPYPAISEIYPQDGSAQEYYSGDVSIYFVSPMEIDSIKDRVEISPKPEAEIEWYYNQRERSISFYGLDPSTRYTLTIQPGMRDIYGNEIAGGQTVRFTTGAYFPYAYLEMPYGPVIYRAKGPQEFFARFSNIGTLDLGLYELSGYQFFSLLSGWESIWEYAPPEVNLVQAWQHTNTGGLNQRALERFSLQDESGESLTPGFYFLRMGSWLGEGYDTDQRLLIVSDANLTMKSTRAEALLWLTDLNSGAPVTDAEVTVYDESFQEIEQGSTDADGLLHLELPVSEDSSENRYALVDNGEHLAFASTRWGSGVSPYDFGIWSDYYAKPNQPSIYVYTDRPLYRPGHPVSFKGIVRLNDDLDYRLPEQEEVDVVISSYEDIVYEERLPLSEFGSFTGELLLDENAVLGSYTLNVYFPESQIPEGGGHFSVAEYRKPEFQVSVTADPKAALPGEEFDFTVEANFFSGGAVAEAEVYWGVIGSAYTFNPPEDLRRYSFSDEQRDLGYYYADNFYYSEHIAEGKDQTDEAGSLVVTFPATLGAGDDAQATDEEVSPSPGADGISSGGVSQQLTFEATVTDLAGTSVSARQQVIVHQSAVYPGIRPQKYIGRAEKEQTFELVVADWDYQTVADIELDVAIVERRWHSAQVQNPDGSIEWESSVEEIPIADFEAVTTDAQGHAEVSFTPPNGGIFKATVSATDEFGNQASAATYMWVSGGDYVAWRRSGERRMDLILDKDTYNPGEIAEIMIPSPFLGENYALVTVERGHVRSSEVILLTSNSTIYELPITTDMAPNAYVSVTIIQGADSDQPPDFRLGIAEINVDTSAQTLTVEVSPDKDLAGPGDQVTYTVRTTDMNGDPVSAEVSLALTDLATLTLMGPNSAPILEHFYSPSSLSVRTAVPIIFNIEQYNTEIEELRVEGQGSGSGGGKGDDDFGVIEVREDFPDTAYWNAFVVTDKTGQAQVTITLPDNLTTWRMDSRAVTIDTRVGDTIDDLISTKPLLVRPQTPRFFVVGDEARLGAAVHNNTADDLTVEVSLQAQGVDLLTDTSQAVEIEGGKQAYVTWQARVQTHVDRVDLVFSAEGGGYTDASRPTLTTKEGGGIPVYRYEAPETVGTAGMLTEGGARTEAISLPPEYDQISGELVVQIEPSLVAGMAAGLEYLEHYPYECVEQTVSRFLPNVLTTQALQASGRSNAQLQSNLDAQVSTALQRLYNWQNPDGGWGWWAGRISDDLTSAYVLLGLAEAERAGYAVSSFVIDQAVSYLSGHLLRLESLDPQYLLNRQAFKLFVLARAGEPDVSKTVQLYDLRQSMSLYARAFLAQTLHMIDPEDPRLDTLISDFANAAIVSATGTHWEEERRDTWNWNTDTRTTAIILGALIEIDPENALNVNAVRWLMTHRTKGYWRSTQETAWSLIGMTDWMIATGELEAEYQYAVAMNGQQAGHGEANHGNLEETFELRLDVAEMLTGETNRLTIARDAGPGNLYYTAHLTVNLPVEDIQSLDRGIIISRSYFESPESDEPITQIQQGDTFLARLTIVVPNSLHYVVIDDPLPAGLVAVDQSLETSPQETAPERYDRDDFRSRGWGWWYFDHVELRDERVVISADYLPAGTYVYTYLVRASTPGEFRVIPPTAQEFYFPEVYGRGEGSLIEVMP